MRMVQLVRLERAIEESIGNHPEYMQALAQDDWARVADLVHGLVGRTLVSAPVSVDELRWGGYFVVDEATREVVGSCAFKSAPTEEGTVEIAYLRTRASRGVGTQQGWLGNSSNWRAARQRSGGLSPTRCRRRMRRLAC